MDSQTSATSSGIRVSRPAVLVEGRKDPFLSPGLKELSIRETVHGLYRCEARFGNWGPKGSAIDFLYFDWATLDFGKAMQIQVDTNKIFDGRISAIEAEFHEGAPPEITVLLEDRMQDMRMTRRTRTFNNVTDADIMNRIAADYGLKPTIDIQGPTYRVLAQINQSDLTFVLERARSIDAEVWIDDKNIFVSNRTRRNGGTVKLNYGGELREFCATADLAGQRTSVSVNGWDVAGKAPLTYQAGEEAISNELNGDVSGISILRSAFGEHKEALAHTVPLSSQEAQVGAESVLRMTARRFVIAHGMAQGNALLRVGSYVDLQNLGPVFSGKYYLTEVHQAWDADGYITNFTAERPGITRSNHA